MLCSRSRLANDLCTGRHDAHGLAPGVYGLFDHRKLRMLSLKPRVSLTIVDKENGCAGQRRPIIQGQLVDSQSGCRDLNPGPLDRQSPKGGILERVADLRVSVNLLVGPRFLVAVGIPCHPLFFGAARG